MARQASSVLHLCHAASSRDASSVLRGGRRIEQGEEDGAPSILIAAIFVMLRVVDLHCCCWRGRALSQPWGGRVVRALSILSSAIFVMLRVV